MVPHCRTFSPSNLKELRYESALSEKRLLVETETHRKLQPIPIVRRSLPNSKKLRSRIRLEGHKYFSTLVVSGEDTSKILKGIKKSRALRLVQSFEFDPYFCRESCLQPLTNVLQKMKVTKRLCLFLRRVERRNETNILSPYLCKIPRLIKLKICFPKTTNVDHDGLDHIGRTIGRCNSLKRVTYQFFGMKDVHEVNKTYFMESHRRNIHLEELRFDITLNKEFYCPEGGSDEQPKLGKFRAYKMKRFESKLSIPNEWSQINEDNSYPLSTFSIAAPYFTNLREARIQLKKHTIVNDRTTYMLRGLGKMVHLHTLNFEFLACQTGELETLNIAAEVTRMPYLKRFIFQFRQRLPLSEECVAQFINYIVGMKNLESFDLYFKRVSLTEQLLPKFAQQLSKNFNIRCECSKNSIWASKP